MSKYMCSLSGMEKDNRGNKQTASKQNSDATKREICPTMGSTAVKEKALVIRL